MQVYKKATARKVEIVVYQKHTQQNAHKIHENP